MRILVINGPNLNMLGTREPEKYGTKTLASIIADLRDQGAVAVPALEVMDFQSNHEGAIVDFLQAQAGEADGLIINAGAFTHSSYAIRDAIANAGLTTVEVHITNIHARESFRHHSVIADIVAGQVVGLGGAGYGLALEWQRQRLASLEGTAS
jgi:3-dehydroquinate dehydratase-2